MLSTLLIATCCAWGQTTAPADYPADWPPLPDFKTTVDYVQWYENRLTEGVTDNAAPLWEEIRESRAKDPETRREIAHMWGRSASSEAIEGMFTGDEPTPDRYTWDPADHPAWEIARQHQRDSGLLDKLAEISRHKHYAVRMNWPDSSKDEGKVGWTEEDRLLIRSLLPSLAVHRQAIKVLLQNAWRTERGRVDPEAMFQALTTSYRMVNQLDTDHSSVIGLLVGNATRSLIDDSLLHALEENVFDDAHLELMNRWLTDHTRAPPDWSDVLPLELAYQLETLQFAYLPENRPPADEIRPNRKNLAKLYRQAERDHEKWPTLYSKPVDFVSRIDRYDPTAAVRQLVDMNLEFLRLAKEEKAQRAISEAERIYGEFMENPDLHILLRQDPFRYMAGLIRLWNQSLASYRATRVICALHNTKAKTGKWPSAMVFTKPYLPAKVRMDPFAGKRGFIYRVENGEMTLYSVSVNGKDDGGAHNGQWRLRDKDDNPIDADYVFWPIQRPKR